MRITNKANQSLSFLRRNLSTASLSVKEEVYLTYVHPKLEFISYSCINDSGVYSANHWVYSSMSIYEPAPLHGIATIRKTSKLLKWFNVVPHTLSLTHMIAIYSVTTILSQLQWENLQYLRRSKACIIFVYEIINRLVCIQHEPYFVTGNINLQRN